MESKQHYLRIGGKTYPVSEQPEEDGLRGDIEPWLSAVLQSEHLSLLLGSGFTIGVGALSNVAAPDMTSEPLAGPYADQVEKAATRAAELAGRKTPNIEDRIRAVLDLIAGLEIIEESNASEYRNQLNTVLQRLANDVLRAERELRRATDKAEDGRTQSHLISFLLTFASRTTTRERLHLFTTNYDRLVEWGCDLAGIRTIDRFVGGLEPLFRASRLEVDLHYNPPGIRGEPRYLEGVLRFSKLHGSLDWQSENGALRRVPLPFGAEEDHSSLPSKPSERLMIYPNPAKDIETLAYPYAELFRDFSAAICRPNTALVTYGYGFGDDHINRVIADMLSIPSTHLVVISYDWAGGRLLRWLEEAGHEAQISLLIGPHFGSLETLVTSYLPAPAIDMINLRRADLLRRRSTDAAKVQDHLGKAEDDDNPG